MIVDTSRREGIAALEDLPTATLIVLVDRGGIEVVIGCIGVMIGANAAEFEANLVIVLTDVLRGMLSGGRNISGAVVGALHRGGECMVVRDAVPRDVVPPRTSHTARMVRSISSKCWTKTRTANSARMKF